MLKAGDVLDLSPLGALFHVERTASETDGAAFEMVWELAPRSGGTPVHVHPRAKETYEVLDGSLDLFVDGQWRTLQKGERLTVDENVAHTFRNSSPDPARVFNAHEPALHFDEYFAGLHGLVERGIITSPSPSPKALLHLAILMTSHPDEIRAVKPPHALLKVMAAAGKALGYKA